MLACAFLWPAPAWADEPAPPDAANLVQRRRDAWSQCTAGVAKALLRGDRSPEAVADAAFQRCKAREQALARALGRQFGTDGAARVLDLVRATDRTNLVRVIEELRARP